MKKNIWLISQLMKRRNWPAKLHASTRKAKHFHLSRPFDVAKETSLDQKPENKTLKFPQKWSYIIIKKNSLTNNKKPNSHTKNR